MPCKTLRALAPALCLPFPFASRSLTRWPHSSSRNMPRFPHLRAGTDQSHSLPKFPHCPCEKGGEHSGLICLRPCSQSEQEPETLVCTTFPQRTTVGSLQPGLQVVLSFPGLECASLPPPQCRACVAASPHSSGPTVGHHVPREPFSGYSAPAGPTLLCLGIPVVFSRALVIICS